MMKLLHSLLRLKKQKWKNNDFVFENFLSKHKVKCKCGHTIVLLERKYAICGWCGRNVYRSKKDEFEDKLKKEIKK